MRQNDNKKAQVPAHGVKDGAAFQVIILVSAGPGSIVKSLMRVGRKDLLVCSWIKSYSDLSH
jgi:hypothetical protein